MTHQVFISHSSRDRAVADQVCDYLERAGVGCWISHRNIAYGDEFDEKIVDAIEASRAMVLIFSQHANDSPNVRNEVRLAKQQELLIIPLRIESVPLSKSLRYHLSAAHWLDAPAAAVGDSLPHLVNRLKGVIDRPPEGGPTADGIEDGSGEADTDADAVDDGPDLTGLAAPSLPWEPSLTAENPWPGLRPYAEEDAPFFHGREREAKELLHCVRRAGITFFFGSSGLGKTSVLRAGLFPLLRRTGLLPVPIRLDAASNAPSLREQVLHTLDSTARAHALTGPLIRPERPLFQHFMKPAVPYRIAGGRPVVPVLVFDQFEEVLMARRISRSAWAQLDEFLDELRGLDDALESCRVLLCLREDLLAEIEVLRSRSLGAQSYRLTGLSGQSALRVTQVGGRDLVPPDVGERIVRSIAGVDGTADPLDEFEVEPMLLSLYLRELNEHRKNAALHAIDPAQIQARPNPFLAKFYASCLRGVAPAVRRFIEEKLITIGGFRNTIAMEDALAHPGVTEADLEILVQRHLLRIEVRRDRAWIELAHDALVPAALTSRERSRHSL